MLPAQARRARNSVRAAAHETTGPSTSTARLGPPQTCSAAVARARQALRSLRDARPAAQGTSTSAAPQATPSVVRQALAQPAGMLGLLTSYLSPAQRQLSPGAARLAEQAGRQQWVSIELPLPVQPSMLSSAGAGGQADVLRANDEADWPGGMQQRFRALRPLVDALLEGYDARFLGLVEFPADGVGVWSTHDMTVIGAVTTPTLPTLIKLLEGGYGARVQLPGHTIVAVNPQWSSSAGVGQPWEWELRQKAGVVLGELPPAGGPPAPSLWDPVYYCRVLRTSDGTTGLLHRPPPWPGPWELYATPLDNARELGPCVLRCDMRPSAAQVVDALRSTKGQMLARGKQLLEESKGGPWPWSGL